MSASALWLDLPLPETFVHVWQADPPQPTERELQLHELVRTYHRSTELYDRGLPHFRHLGSAWPADSRARALSNRFASQERARLSAGFTTQEWVAANSRYVASRECDTDLAALPWLRAAES